MGKFITLELQYGPKIGDHSVLGNRVDIDVDRIEAVTSGIAQVCVVANGVAYTTSMDLDAVLTAIRRGRGEEEPEQDTEPLLFQNAQWAVTEWGMKALSPNPGYPIEAERLVETTECEGCAYYDWLLHMAEKSWVDLPSFVEAFRKALEIHRAKCSPAPNADMLHASIERALHSRQKLYRKVGPGD